MSQTGARFIFLCHSDNLSDFGARVEQWGLVLVCLCVCYSMVSVTRHMVACKGQSCSQQGCVGCGFAAFSTRANASVRTSGCGGWWQRQRSERQQPSPSSSAPIVCSHSCRVFKVLFSFSSSSLPLLPPSPCTCVCLCLCPQPRRSRQKRKLTTKGAVMSLRVVGEGVAAPAFAQVGTVGRNTFLFSFLFLCVTTKPRLYGLFRCFYPS